METFVYIWLLVPCDIVIISTKEIIIPEFCYYLFPWHVRIWHYKFLLIYIYIYIFMITSFLLSSTSQVRKKIIVIRTSETIEQRDSRLEIDIKCMHEHLQNNASADGFRKPLLEMGNGKLAIDESTQC